MLSVNQPFNVNLMNKEQNMKKFICGMILFFGIVQSFAASAADWQGIWCDEAYLRTLRTSYSPKAAFAASHIPMLLVDMAQKTVGVSYHMHEMPVFTISSVDASGAVALAEQPQDILSLTFLEKDNKIRLEYTDGQLGKITATFINISPEIDRFEQTFGAYMNAIVLAGDYQDEAGNPYHFDTQNADWNGNQFRYAMMLDFIEFEPLDVVCEANEQGICQTMYGFAANGSVLQLYEYNDDTKQIGKRLFELTKPSSY